MRKLLWVVSALIVISLCGTAGLILGTESKPASTFVEDEGTQHTSAPVSQRADTIRPGTWEVGKDVKPGKYKTAGATNPEIPLCYWHVMEDGQIMAQGVKDQVGAQGIVTLTKGDLFETNGCEPWYASE